MRDAPTFTAVLRALDALPRRPSGLQTTGYSSGDADGEVRNEAWGICPACSLPGLRVERREDGRATVTCGNGGCRRDVILEALAAALLEMAAAA